MKLAVQKSLSVCNVYTEVLTVLKNGVQAYWSDIFQFGVWMGETGGAYNSGRNTVTNRLGCTRVFKFTIKILIIDKKYHGYFVTNRIFK